MARTGAVWGIDIGQCSLKALRCRPHDDDPDRIVADAFDFIEYPKILSQPDAEPDELIADALNQFLSRNSVEGDRVAISVGGQAGLVRFIKLPPVEAKKIPDIVRFEARQQIPFDLNDVIWDYQRLGGGAEEEGFALETEIGLFAMKRDTVLATLEPYQKARLEVDYVQLTPLALYNFAVFDQLPDLPPPDEYDPEDPPESLVIISLGTDATDLVVTNGYRVWQRSVPIGGNHFTKALTKELKLTFAKAEHLKRNATAAEDPKAVFQAMRPVFSDLLTELQRSIGYFSSINRNAKIGRVIALGNAIKLPGLRRYLSQSLGFEVERVEQFPTLSGSQVLSAPAFRENAVSFAVCYGLALQGMNRGKLTVNLLPSEIVRERLIRRKKPWAVAAAAVLLLGGAISFASHTLALGTVDTEVWKSAESRASAVDSRASQVQRDAEEAVQAFDSTKQIGDHLIGNVEGRIVWLELLRAINECLPPYDREDRQAAVPRAEDSLSPADEIAQREELHITSMDVQRVNDLAQWFARVHQWYQPDADEQIGDSEGEAEAVDAAGAGTMGAVGAGMGAAEGMPGGMDMGSPAGGMGMEGVEGMPGEMGGEGMGGAGAAVLPTVAGGPEGEGFVIQLTGYHYHNYREARRDQGAQYVRDTLIERLRNHEFELPKVDEEGHEFVSMKELGIGFPVLINPGKVEEEVVNLTPNLAAGRELQRGRGMAGEGAAGSDLERNTVKLLRFDFVVHFAWKPLTPTEREQKRLEEEQQKEQEQQAPSEEQEPDAPIGGAAPPV
ncbi:MAG: pilus assembly protein PilM [Thermoguttaceae bacterium]|jgi:type IV pilus assembly protein PilM|nr:pilus assembly protein PilM [Thermoguttaceae bacterium]